MANKRDLGAAFPEILSRESIRPLTPRDIDLDYIRHKFKEGGIETDLSPEAHASLAKKTFLTFHDKKGRGPGLAEAIGPDRVVPLLELGYELMNPHRKLTEGNDKSPSRGMRQWVADLVQLAADPEPTDEKIAQFCLRTNQRVKKGYPPNKFPKTFASIPDPEPTFGSVPPDSIPKLWDFLTTPLKK